MITADAQPVADYGLDIHGDLTKQACYLVLVASFSAAGYGYSPSSSSASPSAFIATEQPTESGAKHATGFTGNHAANHLRGDLPLADWAELNRTGALVLDVRSNTEYQQGHIPDALNIPLEELRTNLDELPKDKDIRLVCGVGQRAYYAIRILMQNGFRVKVLSGGMQTFKTWK